MNTMFGDNPTVVVEKRSGSDMADIAALHALKDDDKTAEMIIANSQNQWLWAIIILAIILFGFRALFKGGDGVEAAGAAMMANANTRFSEISSQLTHVNDNIANNARFDALETKITDNDRRAGERHQNDKIDCVLEATKDSETRTADRFAALAKDNGEIKLQIAEESRRNERATLEAEIRGLRDKVTALGSFRTAECV